MSRHTWKSPGSHKESKPNFVEEMNLLLILVFLSFLCYGIIVQNWEGFTQALFNEYNIIINGNFTDNEILYTLYGSMGIITFWRYTNLFIFNYPFAYYYLFIEFPRRQKQTDCIKGLKNKKLGVICTTYNKSPTIIRHSFQSLLKEIDNYGVEACITIATSKGQQGDRDHSIFSRELKRSKPTTCHVTFNTFKQEGTGKREAIVKCINHLEQEGGIDYIIIMDGDNIIELNSLSKMIPFFLQKKRGKQIGAITCNNKAYVQGSNFFTAWLRLRFHMRHIDLASCMCVLTGRFSIIRAKILFAPGVREIIGNHVIQTFLSGNVKALSGDDKSTFKAVMDQNYETLYIPNVYSYSMEDLPIQDVWWKNYWWYGTSELTKRYSGNMLLVAGELIRLGVEKIGWRRWWKLHDQRLAFWTPLSGLIAALILSVTIHPLMIILWISWVLFSRSMHSIIIAYFNRDFSFYNILVLPYIQFMGSFIKLKRIPNLHVQKWNNQGIIQGRPAVLLPVVNLGLIIIMTVYTLMKFSL